MTPASRVAPAAGGVGGPTPQNPRSISTRKKGGRIAAFVPALLDPAAAVPEGLVDGSGRAAGKRFDVYRNNVVVSLTEALAAGFPVIEKLVGGEFFAAMAGVFVRAHPPSSPVLALYGADFPAFLEAFPPVAHLPYLADTARLEFARRLAYHAADAAPVAAEALQHPRLAEARLRLAPPVRLVASPYPVATIWRANTEPGAPPARGGPECVLVTRPGWDPRLDVIAPSAGRFVGGLLEGRSFDAALEAAGDGLDLAAILALLLETSSITRIEVPE